jgi:hypothetical protein
MNISSLQVLIWWHYERKRWEVKVKKKSEGIYVREATEAGNGVVKSKLVKICVSPQLYVALSPLRWQKISSTYLLKHTPPQPRHHA